MKAVFAREDLMAALGGAVVDKKASNAALGGVLIRATKGGVTVLSTDSLMTVASEWDASVERLGEVLVSHQSLLSVVKALGSPTVLLHLVGNQLHVKGGSITNRINIEEADNFPPAPTVKSKGAMTVTGGKLRQLFTETMFSVSADDNRYGLNGLLFESVDRDGETWLRAISTDGSRLTYGEIGYSGDLQIPRKRLIPRAVASYLSKCADGEEVWEIRFGDTFVSAARPGLTITARLVDGEFPEYRQVMPAEHQFKGSAIVDCGDLSRLLVSACVLATDRNHLIRMQIGDGKIGISARNVERGDVEGEITAETTGELLTGFNATFFREIIAATKAEKIKLRFGAALDPCICTVEGRDDFLAIVMPMRLE